MQIPKQYFSSLIQAVLTEQNKKTAQRNYAEQVQDWKRLKTDILLVDWVQVFLKNNAGPRDSSCSMLHFVYNSFLKRKRNFQGSQMHNSKKKVAFDVLYSRSMFLE